MNQPPDSQEYWPFSANFARRSLSAAKSVWSKTEGLAQGIGLVDISLKCVQPIDVVERAQLIEPQDVAVHELAHPR